VYLRSGGPAGGYITGAANATPIVLAVNSTSGLNAGDTLSIEGVAVVNAQGACTSDPNPPYNISTANGLRRVKAIVDATHFSITDLNGVDIAGNGAWCGGSTTGWNGGAQTFGKLSSFSLVDHPRAWFDGSNGTVTRHWALGTQNGLISLIVSSSHVATLTTNFNHDVKVNDPISVWGTTSPTLNNGHMGSADYSVTAVTSTTYSFSVPGTIPAGDYTTNAACGPAPGNPNMIGGTDNCVRISQFAVQSSPAWAHNWIQYGDTAWYTSILDGGTRTDYLSTPWCMLAGLFLVDQSNQAALNGVLYGITRVERVAGANFAAYEPYNDGGTNELSDFASFVWADMGIAYEAGRNYLTSAQKTVYLAKMYNDISDATPCVKTTPKQKTLAAGAAQAGDATHITLVSSDGHGNGYYVNNVVMLTVPNGACGAGMTCQDYGVVTAYNAATKVATVNAWTGAGDTPATGTAYTIYATVTLSGATITGYNTTFTADVHAGDMVYGGDGWGYTPKRDGSLVTAVNSDTSLTVVNGDWVTANATPSPLWWVTAWNTSTNTDCGLKRLQNYWQGAFGVQPIQYPPRGGNGWAPASDGTVPFGGNNGYTYAKGRMMHDFAAAEDDPRAVVDSAVAEGMFFDYLLRLSLNYHTGLTQSGTSYSWRTGVDGPAAAWVLQHSVVGFPSMDTSGPWTTGLSIVEMYLPRPDQPFFGGSHTKFLAPYGTEGDSVFLYPYGQIFQWFVMDHGAAFNPSAASSGYLKSFLNAMNAWGTDRIDGAATLEASVKVDPRISAVDYTTQPTQYYFGATSQPTCAPLTGWPCPATFRADAFISRTGWTSASDTHLFYQSRGFFADHDNPQAGDIELWKAGPLLASDAVPPDGHGTVDSTVGDSALQFTGANTFLGGYSSPLMAFISRWASANHGSWPGNYGDRNSSYVYAMSDLTGAYATAYNHVWEHVAHFKKPGAEEVVMVFDDVDASNAPTQIVKHWHFPQNGETVAGQGAYLIYDEGNTTFSSGTVIEQQSGTTANGDPPHVYNLIGRFFSPGTITMQDDGSTFTGASGHTHRVSLCGGGSCGSTVNTFRQLSVFKIAAQPDTALTATALNPEAHWTGVQTADKVALFAVGGIYSAIAGFTTTHAGVAQYLFAGLAPGTYAVTVNNTPVSGSPFTVSSGDTTVYFESTAGTVSVNGSAAPAPAGAALAGGVALSAGAHGH